MFWFSFTPFSFNASPLPLLLSLFFFTQFVCWFFVRRLVGGHVTTTADCRQIVYAICNTFVLLRIGWHYIILSISYSRNVCCNTLYSLVFRSLLALLHTRHLSGLVCHNRVARDCSHSLRSMIGTKIVRHFSFVILENQMRHTISRRYSLRRKKTETVWFCRFVFPQVKHEVNSLHMRTMYDVSFNVFIAIINIMAIFFRNIVICATHAATESIYSNQLHTHTAWGFLSIFLLRISEMKHE